MGISALVVTNKYDSGKKDIYYLYNDHLGSLIAAIRPGSDKSEQVGGL